MDNQTNQKDSHVKLLQGSAWMTFGSIFSRILGAVYIIPWYAWMGSHGNVANALTAKSYNIYSLFIIISTAGIPGAVAKQVAAYNARNEYGVGKKLFQRGIYLMMGLGIVSAAIMYFAAGILSGGDIRQIPVLQSLALAVLIIPVMSLMRGFFQGYNDMAPSALSQIIEQLARVIWMLVTAYLIMQVQHGNYVDAVTQSNFAAFIGALFGILLLLYYYARKKHEIDYLVLHSNNEVEVSTKNLLIEIIQQSIPFIIIDSGITFFQLIDQYTFHSFIDNFVHASYNQIESWYALFGLNANKLIMIVISLATAMAVTAIPLLAGAHATNNREDIKAQIENTLELFFFIMIPSALGMAAISGPLYTVFYGYDPTGASVLYLSSFVAILLGLFTVIAAILQGLSNNKLAIKYLVIGVIVKLIFQFPAIYFLNIYGPLVATAIGMGVVCFLGISRLKNHYQFNYLRMGRRFAGTSIFAIIMFLAVALVVFLLEQVIDPVSRMSAVIEILVALPIGVIVFGLLTLKTGLAEKILGSRIIRLLHRFHINV